MKYYNPLARARKECCCGCLETLCHENSFSPDCEIISRAWYKILMEKILRDNKRSMRKMASDLIISPKPMRIVEHQLGF
uniref:MarR family transcriptional regulator n=1 Tax=Heterorhabditis bacteriophora TaxID=37862 RepID=A0A1I7WUW8_HETBA